MIVKSLLLSCFLFVSGLAMSQALQEINYNYLYSSSESFSFKMKPVRTAVGWDIFFELVIAKQGTSLSNFDIEWEKRSSVNRKEYEKIALDSVGKIFYNDETLGRKAGKISLGSEATSSVLVAKVVDTQAKRAWYFFEILRPGYPVNGYLEDEKGIAFKSYFGPEDVLTINNGNSARMVASHYHSAFPAAAPAYSEAMAKVSTTIMQDTTFFVSAGEAKTYAKGMYLVQKDTNDAKGFVFHIYDDYPKYSRLESLVDPLIYITTKQEFEKLKQTRGDKKSFDRLILGITADADRAKSLIRSYFRNVEMANQYFTSYKEGWKTDRGMIYIIFGQPDEVFRFADREVWNYKNSMHKVTFDFVLSSTLFDPDNYVLVRNKKFKDTWYEVIDLWRNARF